MSCYNCRPVALSSHYPDSGVVIYVSDKRTRQKFTPIWFIFHLQNIIESVCMFLIQFCFFPRDGTVLFYISSLGCAESPTMLSGDIVWQKLPQENFLSCFIPKCFYACSAFSHQLLKEACAHVMSCECDLMNRPTSKVDCCLGEDPDSVGVAFCFVFHRKIIIASI